MASHLQEETVWKRLSTAKTSQQQERALSSLARLPDVNAAGPTGVSLLMRAARTHDLFALEALLGAGAHPNATDGVEGSPGPPSSVLSYVFCDWSFRSLDVDRVRQVLKALLLAGADPCRPGLWESVCASGSVAAHVFLEEVQRLPDALDPWSPPLRHALWSVGDVSLGALASVSPEQARKLAPNGSSIEIWQRVLDALLDLGADPCQPVKGVDAFVHALATCHFQPSPGDEGEVRRIWNEYRLSAELSRSLSPPRSPARIRF